MESQELPSLPLEIMTRILTSLPEPDIRRAASTSQAVQQASQTALTDEARELRQAIQDTGYQGVIPQGLAPGVIEHLTWMLKKLDPPVGVVKSLMEETWNVRASSFQEGEQDNWYVDATGALKVQSLEDQQLQVVVPDGVLQLGAYIDSSGDLIYLRKTGEVCHSQLIEELSENIDEDESHLYNFSDPVVIATDIVEIKIDIERYENLYALDYNGDLKLYRYNIDNQEFDSIHYISDNVKEFYINVSGSLIYIKVVNWNNQEKYINPLVPEELTLEQIQRHIKDVSHGSILYYYTLEVIEERRQISRGTRPPQLYQRTLTEINFPSNIKDFDFVGRISNNGPEITLVQDYSNNLYRLEFRSNTDYQIIPYNFKIIKLLGNSNYLKVDIDDLADEEGITTIRN